MGTINNPHVHWRYIRCRMFILILLLIAASFYFLDKIKKEEIFQVTPQKQAPQAILNEDLLNEVMKSFDKKAQKEAELKIKSKEFADPSL